MHGSSCHSPHQEEKALEECYLFNVVWVKSRILSDPYLPSLLKFSIVGRICVNDDML